EDVVAGDLESHKFFFWFLFPSYYLLRRNQCAICWDEINVTGNKIGTPLDGVENGYRFVVPRRLANVGAEDYDASSIFTLAILLRRALRMADEQCATYSSQICKHQNYLQITNRLSSLNTTIRLEG
ncbi:hypothetical protein V1478_002841, partial [Vespula squamosa]